MGRQVAVRCFEYEGRVVADDEDVGDRDGNVHYFAGFWFGFLLD